MNKTRLLAGLLLATAFLYLFLRDLDLRQVWITIRQGNPYWLLFSLAFTILNYYMRSIRWRYFFLPIKKTAIRNLFTTTIIGFAASTIFPAKIGELVRPYLLGTKENISRTAALATVVVERVFDLLSILFLLVLYLFLLMDPKKLSPQAAPLMGELAKTGLIVFAAAVGVTVFLYYLKSRPVLMKKILNRIERLLPGRLAHSLEGLLDSFVEGLSILHDPRILLSIACWSILFWLVICVGFWAAVRAYIPGFEFTHTFLVMILLAIGVAVPTPGGVGSYHFACKIGLTRFFSIAETQASAVALVSHFIAFVPITILGIFLAWHEGLSARKITKLVEKPKEAKQP